MSTASPGQKRNFGPAMDNSSPEYRLQLRELQLNSLFEFIKAINDDAPEADLYRVYEYVLRAIQKVAKLALYVREPDRWVCQATYGTTADFFELEPPTGLLKLHEISQLETWPDLGAFAEFDTLLPVWHLEAALAMVFIGRPGHHPTPDDDGFIATLSHLMLVAIENKKLARQQLLQQMADAQMHLARDVQALLFPKRLPYTDRLRVVASYLPHHTVGGDYYDFLWISPDKFLVCVADVSGKGVPAAILMSNFQAALRILVRRSTSLVYVVEELNHLIMSNAQGENFITAFFAEYDLRYKTLTYVNAGHNPPFLLRSGSPPQLLTEGTTVLGGFDPLPFLTPTTLANLSDFLLFCFTDGFIETYNDAGEPFGSEQMMAFVGQNLHLGQKSLHERLIQHLNQFKGRQAYVDDITLLSCRVQHV
jgi:phosphoserine phosphatase RsbU/P